MSKLSLVCAALFLRAGPAMAQQLSGTVLGPGGSPVAGAEIHAYDATGSEVQLAGHQTDSSGGFLAVFLDGPGVHRLDFVPPAPPATTLLVRRIEGVAVGSGTTDLGTIVLAQGVALSGRTVQAGGAVVPEVTLQVVDGTSGLEVPIAQRRTDASGQFVVSVPEQAVELRLDATSAPTLLASRALDVAPMGDTALGDLLLPVGVTVTGTVRRLNGSAIQGVDLDLSDVATGRAEYTPGDDSDALGNVSVVVAPGTYDIEFRPPAGEPLASRRLASQIVSTSTTLGIVTMLAGRRLSGTVTHAGLPVPDVDVDVFAYYSGEELFLADDSVDASGAYSVYVLPAQSSLYTVVFRPPACSTLHPHFTSVLIPADTVFDDQLVSITADVYAFNGNGLALDMVVANPMILGQDWSAPLVLGHDHGSGGTATLRIRTRTVDGPNFVSPIGGRLTENLIGGPFLALLSGTHDGSTGGFGTLPIPSDPCLAGTSWAAQYTVIGGGYGDFSSAVSGIIGVP